MSHVRDLWTIPGERGRKIRGPKWGHGRRWQARWVEHGTEHARAFPTKDAAEQHLAQVTVHGTRRRPAPETFGIYAERWRAHQLHHRPSTVATVEQTFYSLILPVLGSMRLADITRTDIQDAVAGWAATYSPSRVHIAYGYVATIYRHAVEDELVPRSPCTRISLPPLSRVKVEPLTVAQVEAVAAAISPRYRSMVVVAAATGMRSGELRGLTVDRVMDGAVRIDRQLVGVRGGRPVFGPPKSAASVRTVGLGAVPASALQTHLDVYGPGPDGVVWSTRMGTAAGKSAAGTVWRSAVAGMGLRPRSGWHDLRHFHASLLIAAGLSVRAVCDRLGHADPAETLRTYSHLWPSDEARAVRVTDDALQRLAAPFSE